jgi:hypothetical protein
LICLKKGVQRKWIGQLIPNQNQELKGNTPTKAAWSQSPHQKTVMGASAILDGTWNRAISGNFTAFLQSIGLLYPAGKNKQANQ